MPVTTISHRLVRPDDRLRRVRFDRTRIVLDVEFHSALARCASLFAEVFVGFRDFRFVAVARIRLRTLTRLRGRRVLVVAIVRGELRDLLLFDLVGFVADEMRFGVVLLIRRHVLAHGDSLVGLRDDGRRRELRFFLLLFDLRLWLLDLFLLLLFFFFFLLRERLRFLFFFRFHFRRRRRRGHGRRDLFFPVADRDLRGRFELFDLPAQLVGEREEGLVIVVRDADFVTRDAEPEVDPRRDARPEKRHQSERNCALAVAHGEANSG